MPNDGLQNTALTTALRADHHNAWQHKLVGIVVDRLQDISHLYELACKNHELVALFFFAVLIRVAIFLAS